MSGMFFDSKGNVGTYISSEDIDPKAGQAISIIMLIGMLVSLIVMVVIMMPSRDFICPKCGEDAIDKVASYENNYQCGHLGCTIEGEHALYHCDNCWTYYHQ